MPLAPVPLEPLRPDAATSRPPANRMTHRLPTTRPAPTRPAASGGRGAGYTLVEMMVAMSIAALMFFFVNTLFNTTQRAVRLGIHTNEALGTADAIAEFLQDDAENMIGPQRWTTDGDVTDEGIGGDDPAIFSGQDGGYLVIVNQVVMDEDVAPDYDPNSGDTAGRNAQVYGSARRYDDGPRAPAPDGTGRMLSDQFVRSDQLYFFRTARGVSGETLGSQTAISDDPGGSGDHQVRTDWLPADAGSLVARIWYGHVNLTDPDTGLDPASDTGDPTYTGTLVARPAHRWVLGREAMLLPDGDNDADNPPNNPGGAVNTWPMHYRSLYPLNTNNLRGRFDAVPAFAQLLFMSAADRATLGLNYHLSQEIYTRPNNQFPTDVLASRSHVKRYLPGLLDSLYLDPGFLTTRSPFSDTNVDISRRPRVNLSPAMFDSSSGDPTLWRYNQTHPILGMNVSDFIVEFAADTNGDGQIDVDSDSDGYFNPNATEGQIVWYSMFNLPGQRNDPGNPALQTSLNQLNGDSNQLNHWGPSLASPLPYFPGDNGGVGQSDIDSGFARNPNGRVFAFRHDDTDDSGGGAHGGAFSAWPYLIRVRYRLHDPNGLIVSTGSQANDRVDNDGNDLIDEQDPNERNSTEPAGLAGLWFEHIIPVNRP